MSAPNQFQKQFKENIKMKVENKMKKLVLCAFALVAGLFFIGEAKAQPQIIIDQNAITKSVTQAYLTDYADKLEAKLKGKSVGYSFTVISNGVFGVSRAGGDARRFPDANPRKMTADDKFNIASVSKTITAAAVMKLLYQNRIRVDAPVYPYLPPTWTLGANVKTITFRELLTHRAGIRCEKEVTYAFLKECVAGGVTMTNKSEQKYNNNNYGLFRILIPRLAGFKDNLLSNDAQNSKDYAEFYATYVKENVFAPIGLRGIDTKPIAVNPALAYQFPSPVIAGGDFGDMTEISASQGWNMSSKQLATFINGLLYTEKIVPSAISEKMKTDQLGLWQANIGGKIVDYEHGGYYPGKNDKGALWNAGEMNTMIAAFPNGVSVAIIINSQFGPGQSFADAARAAMSEMK
jgi:D-alanyl-D-alanine carboxypeptidase